MNLRIKSLAYFILMHFIFQQISYNVYGKLVFSTFNTSESNLFKKISRCLYLTVHKYYEGRTLVLLKNEIRDSLGEELIKSGLNITIDISNSVEGKKYHALYLLQPKFDISVQKQYKVLVQESEKSSLFIVLWPPRTILHEIGDLHQLFWEQRILKVVSFVATVTEDFNIYTNFPYTKEFCGTGRNVEKVESCTADGFQTNFVLFSSHNTLMNFYGCEINCFGNNQYPESVVNYNPNGTCDVQGNVVYLLDALKSHYNLSLRYVQMFNDKHGSLFYNNMMQKAIMRNHNITFEFGLGSFTTLQALMNPKLEYIFGLNPECISWAIPPYAGNPQSFLSLYLVHFTFTLWCHVVLVLFLGSLFVILARHVEGKELNVMNVLKIIIMIMFSIIADSPKGKSNLISVNFFVLIWSIWALELRCAYEASWGSLMIKPRDIQDLKTHKELIEKNMRIAGGIMMYKTLKESANDDASEILLDKFEILPPTDNKKIIEEIYDTKKLAVLLPNRYTKYTSRKYAKKRGLHILASVMKPCFLNTYSAPIIIKKGSIMAEPLNRFMMRCFEAGLTKYWKTKDSFPEDKPPHVPVSFDLKKFYDVFYIYIFGVLAATIVFIIELVLPHWTRKH